MLIFTFFKETCNQLIEKLKNYNPLLCTGDIPDDVVAKNVELFNEDNEHRILIGTGQKIGTGLSMSKKCQYAIFVGYPWNDAILSQWQDRIHRVNNTRPAFIYMLWTLDTFDLYQKELIETKGAISDYIIDDDQSPELINKLKKYIEDLR